MTLKTDNNLVEQANEEYLKGLAFKAYRKGREKIERDKMITDCLPMVKRIVSQVVSYIKPPLSQDDLVSAGTFGLVKAAEDFNPAKNAEFKTYAYIKIKGAVIDELRKWTFTPANLSKQIRQAEELTRESIEKTGRAPSDEKLADKMNVSVDKLYKIFENARNRHFMSIHGLDDGEPALGNLLTSHVETRPESRLEKKELTEKLAEKIKELPQKERQVIILYYHQELTMKEISLTLEITESRVSQIHAGAVFKLANQLKEFDNA